ncbi:endonuclease/exonuclease/phosphatase family metal-dependent hydrolase [Neorhizobium galegae]|uniref:endonuclease/exonuclease/phosphatase family protein n=1 Tax=Neorhizobium galegae TaxID=399 RepID=UPI001AE6C7EC|nr:endonuclease/exonuclease/phosphatase family protein [Neorhizobium galegae]MBP2557537.1 endonuclease/exonuclease/phosphatase family metal-dependent hydrolase [Neorhizobium galegae]
MTDRTSPSRAGPSTARPSPARHRLKILSYNVHTCIGTDRRLDPARVAEVIAAVEPDIIGLQELDVGRSRTGGIDQAHAIASLLQMEFHFHAALNVAEEQYGDAILTALPAKMVKGASLPSHGEQRGALWVEIEVGEHKLQVFNTHLGLLGGDRMRQIGEILGERWMGAPDCQGKPKILIGDFNAIPLTATYKAVAHQMADASLLSGMKPKATFPSRLPLLRIDHVFVSREVTPIATQVVSTPLSRQASDHLPLLVTVEL